MERNESLLPVAKFIAEYAAHMMGSGVHTSRVKRSSKRIGKAFNTDIKLNVSQKTIVISATHNETGETYSEVVDIPALPISFEHNAELSALSWETYDQHLSLEEVRQKYNEIVSAPKMDPMFVLILVGLANASFCRLFGGDWLSNCSFGYDYRYVSPSTDASQSHQSLCGLCRQRICSIAVCFYLFDL